MSQEDSLEIDVALVKAVLLADGWHDVEPGSFRVARYDFITRDGIVLGAGDNSVVAAYGYGFRHPSLLGAEVCGPLTALLGVRVERPDDTWHIGEDE